MCESQPFAHWCMAQKSFMIASTEGEMDMFRRSPKFLLHLTKEEYDLIVYSMINMKNELTRQGKYTDAVDDALIRFLKAKPKKM